MAGFVKGAWWLGRTALRRDALRILEAGLAAVKTRPAIRRLVSLEGDRMVVAGESYDLSKVRRLLVVAIGKAAFEAGSELECILGKRIAAGFVLDVKGGRLRRTACRVGTHPFPSQTNVNATAEIVLLLKDATADDLVLMVVSGGGSALLCEPNDLSCADLELITKAMMAKGATIEEMNVVRKHTSNVLGGQLMAVAHPARVVSLIFSDVPTDDLSVVSSGPTYLDETTVTDAQAVLDKYELLKTCRLPTCNLKETPKDPALFSHVRNVRAVSNAEAVDAMRGEAFRLGYHARVLSTVLTGEARDVGARLAEDVKPGEALIAAGETTVTLLGHGAGGRNQEVALGAISRVPEDALVLSCASDGIDNSPIAGAIADAVVRDAAARKKMDPAAYLSTNDTLAFFAKAGGQIKTGKTGMNVSDLMLALRAPEHL